MAELYIHTNHMQRLRHYRQAHTEPQHRQHTKVTPWPIEGYHTLSALVAQSGRRMAQVARPRAQVDLRMRKEPKIVRTLERNRANELLNERK